MLAGKSHARGADGVGVLQAAGCSTQAVAHQAEILTEKRAEVNDVALGRGDGARSTKEQGCMRACQAMTPPPYAFCSSPVERAMRTRPAVVLCEAGVAVELGRRVSVLVEVPPQAIDKAGRHACVLGV